MRTSGSATSSAKNGSTKMRWRDSGDAIPLPIRVAAKKRNGVTSTQATKTALRRHVRVEEHEPDQRREQHDDPNREPPDGEVARDPREVLEDRERAAELRAAAADAHVEAVREDRVAVPERKREHEYRGERHERLTQPPRAEHVEALRRKHERAVRVRRDAREHRERPQEPGAPVATLERPQQRDVRQRRGEEEDRVHPAVDAVEEEHPARHDDRRRDEPDGAVGEARDEHGDQRHARDREERRDEPKLHEPAARVRDRPREEEVERCAAALAEHRPDQLVRPTRGRRRARASRPRAAARPSSVRRGTRRRPP